ncbi:MAG: class I SAM-dependent methyltransferase [Victivallaceae bacterium]
MKRKTTSSSWEEVSKEYGKSVADKGHYYHRNVILPRLLKLLDFKNPQEQVDKRNISDFLLDLGCGQGVLSRAIPQKIGYLGLDVSPSLIREAELKNRNKNHSFSIKDLSVATTTEHSKNPMAFSHAVALLSLQNMEYPDRAINYGVSLLKEGGVFIAVLNHPCFRIPRLSSWSVDEKQQSVYRRVDRYLTKTSIPIVMNPGKKNSVSTISFHFPLSYWTQVFSEAGLLIKCMEEWISDKTSIGSKSKAENKARKEIPLFLAIKAYKISCLRK